MGAGRDIKMDTIRIRREQKQRNLEATAAREARITKMESHLSNPHMRRGPVEDEFRTIRDGHKVRYERVELDELKFASHTARQLADETLTREAFEGHDPTSRSGYTVKDVRAIVEEVNEEREKMEQTAIDNKMERPSGVDIKDEATVEPEEVEEVETEPEEVEEVETEPEEVEEVE